MLPRPHAFTLVELLVVISIIVVLLAMLTPALDKAIYHAMLVQCSANTRATAHSGILYAHANRRYYPVAEQSRTVNGHTARMLGSDSQPKRDLRLVFERQSLPWTKLLVCPLSEPFEISFEANDADTEVYGSYAVFFGWVYARDRENTQLGTAMNKLGDRFDCSDPNEPDTIYSYRVLVSDQFMEQFPKGSTQGAHQDRDNLMDRLHRFQNGVENPSLEFEGVGVGGKKVTVSEWRGVKRGIYDVNYAMDDGSVLRVDADRHDERLRSAQQRRVPTFNGWGLRLPQ